MQVGEAVVYGMHGVCKITGTEQRTEGGKRQEYLVLEPVYQRGSRFLVPADNDAVLRKLVPLLRPQDIQSLLASAAVHKNCWIADENRRKQEYKNLAASGSRESLLAMLYTLYQNQRQQRALGRRCHICDERFLNDTEKQLAEEIAYSLGMDVEQARLHLRDALSEAS